MIFYRCKRCIYYNYKTLLTEVKMNIDLLKLIMNYMISFTNILKGHLQYSNLIKYPSVVQIWRYGTGFMFTFINTFLCHVFWRKSFELYFVFSIKKIFFTIFHGTLPSFDNFLFSLALMYRWSPRPNFSHQ